MPRRNSSTSSLLSTNSTTQHSRSQVIDSSRHTAGPKHAWWRRCCSPPPITTSTKLLAHQQQQQQQQQSSRPCLTKSSTATILSLLVLILLFTQCCVCKVVVSEDWNYANVTTTTTTTTTTPTTTIMNLNDLMHEATLEEAIEKLRQTWTLKHNPRELLSSQQQQQQQPRGVISSPQVQLAHAQTSTSNSNNNNNLSRSRRSSDNNATTSNLPTNLINMPTAYKYSSNAIVGFMQRIAENMNLAAGDDAAAVKVGVQCAECRNKEDSRQLQLKNIQLNILNKLGFEAPPNVSSERIPKVPALKHFLDTNNHNQIGDKVQLKPGQKSFLDAEYFGPIYQEADDDEGDDYFVSAEKSIVFAQRPPPERRDSYGTSKGVQHFAFSNSLLGSNVTYAILWMCIKAKPEHNSNVSGTLAIYQATDSSTNQIMIKSRKVAGNIIKNGGWIKVDLKRLVAKWFRSPETNWGLTLQAHDEEGEQFHVIRHDDVEFDSELRPYLIVSVSSAKHESRKKRMTNLTCEEKDDEVRCCRYPLTVDFEQFGWNWIIAPKKYAANYCSGECPSVFMNNFPHTHLVQQVGGVVGHTPPGSCCSPKRMNSISMLYVDSNYNVIYGVLPNMVVDRCGCS